MAHALAPDWPEMVGRVVLDSIDSTNAEVLRRARELTGPVWILARSQTQGRGRRGRGWTSPSGNFSASLALPDAGPPAQAARLSFVAALAVHDALAHFVGPQGHVAIKWPNDVLLNGRKISGILLESVSAGGKLQALAVGIGVNLVAAPPHAALPQGAVEPVTLQEVVGDAPSPEVFLDRLAAGFAYWHGRLQTEGFGPVRKAWLAHAARLGQIITARMPRMTCTGRFDGIDLDGALILTTDTGRETIPAAEIYF